MKCVNTIRNASAQAGFTLIEMTFVLLLLGLLARIAVQPIGKLQEHRHWQSTEIQLQTIKQALLAHLVAYGKLPCPINATDSSENSVADVAPPSVSACTNGSGFIAARQLGLRGPTNQAGALLDAWGQPFWYAVSLTSHPQAGIDSLPDWTNAGEAASVGVANLRANLILCHQISAGVCRGGSIRADQIAFVVLSLGADGSTRGEQAENQDLDEYFLVREQSVVDGKEFDDQLIWGTAPDAIYWMLRAGWLP